MSTAARRASYGYLHKTVRRANLPNAYGQPCARCGERMVEGQELDLDHADDRTGYLGFSHATCNRRAGGRNAAAKRAIDPLGERSRTW